MVKGRYIKMTQEINEAEGKYGKYFKKAPVVLAPVTNVPMLHFLGADEGVDLTLAYVHVSEPYVMIDKPHKHASHQFLCFLGGDQKNIGGNYGAEVELYVGEEGEKHVITTPTIVHIPPGLIHGPCIYKRVDSTVVHLDFLFAGKYEKTE